MMMGLISSCTLIPFLMGAVSRDAGEAESIMADVKMLEAENKRAQDQIDREAATHREKGGLIKKLEGDLEEFRLKLVAEQAEIERLCGVVMGIESSSTTASFDGLRSIKGGLNELYSSINRFFEMREKYINIQHAIMIADNVVCTSVDRVKALRNIIINNSKLVLLLNNELKIDVGSRGDSHENSGEKTVLVL